MYAGRFALVVVGVVLLLGSCGGGDQPAVDLDSAAPRAVPAPVQRHPASVSRDSWTAGAWPLAIERGLLTCTAILDNPALYITDGDGRMWPLNGIASSNAARFGAESDLGPIWLDNPDIPGTKVFLTEMINHASTLC